MSGPGDADYEQRRSVWNGMIDRRPHMILRPKTTSDVSEIVCFAARTGLPLSVRCGGHSFPGFSTCDAGIVLDLTRIKDVTVDPKARIAQVGGGALLGDLDRASAPFGLVTPAGLVSHTGAGGLTLGGGMGWTSRRLGLTIDNLLSAEVVTADGKVVEASPQKDAELFWGLRGGGGNFGVVTRFTYRMHPLGPITVAVWQYGKDQTREALRNLALRVPTAPRSLTLTLNVTVDGLSLTAFHSGDDGLGTAAVMAFADLAGPGDGGLVETDYVSLQCRSDAAMHPGRRYYGRGGFISALDGPVIDCMVDLSQAAPCPDAEIYMIQLGGAVADVPEDATAYSGRAGGFYWIVQPIWDDPADDARCLSWGRQGGKRMADLSQSENYLNEQGDVGKELTIKAYGAAKYDRLAQLKQRVDPTNLFRLNQNIAPAGHVKPPVRASSS